MPALKWVPEQPQAMPVVIYLHEQGKQAEAAGELEQLVKAGRTVLAIDLRGVGELSPQGKGWGETFGPDVREAFLGMHINRPLLGQRVFDLLAVVKGLGAAQPVEVIATGCLGPVAQHAALFEAAIQKVTVRDSVESWTAVASTPLSRRQLVNVVPGVLRVYDLGDL